MPVNQNQNQNNIKIGGFQYKSTPTSTSRSRSSKRNDTVKSHRGIPHQFQNPAELHKIMSLFQ
jgi:hypothetical protein